MRATELALKHGPVTFLGPPLEVGPLPALIYFTMSARDSLLQNPYNQVLIPLLGAPLRVFSWDLPYHPTGIEPNEGIKAWSSAHERGEDFMAPFIEKSLQHLEELNRLNCLIDGQLIVAGLSRGAFAAFHLAAASRHIGGVLAFAPLVEFHEATLEKLIPSLAKKWIQGFVSFHDERIHTDKVVEHFIRMAEAAKKEKVAKPEIHLTLYPSIGYKGHGTPEEIFITGGKAILERFSP